MKSFTGQLLLVLLLVGTGGALWFVARAEERVAAAEYSLVSLRYDRAAEELDAAAPTGLLRTLVGRLSTSTHDQRAAARYWAGDDESLANSDDSRLKLLAANAEYRAVRRSGGPWQSVVNRLDGIAKRYADVLRNEPGNEDAAYNYEFVLRVRAAVMKFRQPLPPSDPALTGITVHGMPGAPPQDSDAKKFRMIVPMLPDERQEAEEAGRAGKRIRKG